MTFGFSLYAVSLLVLLVVYFGTELRNLVGGKPLEVDASFSQISRSRMLQK